MSNRDRVLESHTQVISARLEKYARDARALTTPSVGRVFTDADDATGANHAIRNILDVITNTTSNNNNQLSKPGLKQAIHLILNLCQEDTSFIYCFVNEGAIPILVKTASLNITLQTTRLSLLCLSLFLNKPFSTQRFVSAAGPPTLIFLLDNILTNTNRDTLKDDLVFLICQCIYKQSRNEKEFNTGVFGKNRILPLYYSILKLARDTRHLQLATIIFDLFAKALYVSRTPKDPIRQDPTRKGQLMQPWLNAHKREVMNLALTILRDMMFNLNVRTAALRFSLRMIRCYPGLATNFHQFVSGNACKLLLNCAEEHIIDPKDRSVIERLTCSTELICTLCVVDSANLVSFVRCQIVPIIIHLLDSLSASGPHVQVILRVFIESLKRMSEEEREMYAPMAWDTIINCARLHLLNESVQKVAINVLSILFNSLNMETSEKKIEAATSHVQGAIRKHLANGHVMEAACKFLALLNKSALLSCGLTGSGLRTILNEARSIHSDRDNVVSAIDRLTQVLDSCTGDKLWCRNMFSDIHASVTQSDGQIEFVGPMLSRDKMEKGSILNTTTWQTESFTNRISDEKRALGKPQVRRRRMSRLFRFGKTRRSADFSQSTLPDRQHSSPGSSRGKLSTTSSRSTRSSADELSLPTNSSIAQSMESADKSMFRLIQGTSSVSLQSSSSGRGTQGNSFEHV